MTGSGFSGVFRVAMGWRIAFDRCLSHYGTWPESSIRKQHFKKGFFDAQLKNGNKRLFCPQRANGSGTLNKKTINQPILRRSWSR